MKILKILTAILLLPTIIFSQNDPIKWKKISKEEIEYKSFELEPDAPAVILYDYGQMYFDLNPNGENLFLFYERHLRIKILKEEGLKYAEIKIPYRDMNCERYEKELSYDIKAIIHNLNNENEIVSTRYKNKNIKKYDSTDCIKLAALKFPDAKVGSIIEIKYKTPTLDMVWPNSWVFQKSIPVLNSEFRARIPFNFEYLFSFQNTDPNTPIDSSSYSKVISYYSHYGKKYISTINFSGTEYIFKDENLLSQEDLKYAKKLNIHLSRLIAQPLEAGYKSLTRALMITLDESYQDRTPSQRQLLNYPAGYILYNQKNWTDINERLLKDRKFGLALIKHWDTDSIISEITNKEQTNTEKAKAIYKFVKDHMKWNNKYSIFVEIEDHAIVRLINKTGINLKKKNLGDIWEKGEGNSSEINFILIHLLKKAGLEVSPVLSNIEGRLPIDKKIPEFRQFISVLALVETENGKILLDAADPESNFNILAEKYNDSEKFVVSKLESGWIEEIN